MVKRKRGYDAEPLSQGSCAKRTKCKGTNLFDNFSDELVLRTLSFLPVHQLTAVEQVCKRFKRLAADNEIWREKFYNTFVRPRARRIPHLKGLSEQERERQALHYASKSAKWLEHSARPGIMTDWKRRYKVKLNWSRGCCKAQEMTLDCPVRPRTLVKVFDGTIFTASASGLRSYSQRTRPQLLSTYYWAKGSAVPTSLAVDSRNELTLVIVGFEDGSIQAFQVTQSTSIFTQDFAYETGHKARVSGLAVSWPYVLTLSDNRNINLFEMRQLDTKSCWDPLALTSLNSDTMLSPVSLTIRKTPTILIASVAYSFPRLNAGWCLGLQEIRLNRAGEVVNSRLASTVETPLTDHPLRSRARQEAQLTSRSASTGPLPLHPQLMSPPNSLSHSGCYILAGLPDNTLMVYTVRSTYDKLSIEGGRRLWGHTSSVAGAEVSERGKALSVSTKGNEVRVWELEDVLSKFEYGTNKNSTRLKPQAATPNDLGPVRNDLQVALASRGNGLGLAWSEVKSELSLNPTTNESMSGLRHWVGFDDEQVVVLGEKDMKQVLSCYDFA